MSLTHSEHIEPARERHGAHYFLKARPDGVLKPAMSFRPGDVEKPHEYCKECNFAPFFHKGKCPKCGGELEIR